MNHRMPDKMTILNELWLCSRRTPLMRLIAILMRLFSWAASQAASMLSEAALSCRQQPNPGKPFRQSGVRCQAAFTRFDVALSCCSQPATRRLSRQSKGRGCLAAGVSQHLHSVKQTHLQAGLIPWMPIIHQGTTTQGEL